MTTCIAWPQTLDQIREFVDGSHTTDPRTRTRADAYLLVEQTLRRLDYSHLTRADKGTLRTFLGRVTGLSRAQITRLQLQYRTTGRLADRRHATRRSFARRYTNADIELLAEIDALHGTPSGPAARKLCARGYHLFGDRRFERLAGISNGHLYNLRRSTIYRRRRGTLPSPTLAVPFEIGDRSRYQLPAPPGLLRVVSVRRSRPAGQGGLYHLYLMDEATRFQFFGSVERLHPACLAPVLHAVRKTFPFTLRSFHGGNGAEAMNHNVAALLRSLDTDRHVNGHARGGYAERVNAFTQEVLSPYLNYHRLCCFPTEQPDARGVVQRRCRDTDLMTPYERLKSLPGAAACLTPGTTFAALDAIAMAMSDSEAARAVNEAGERLLQASRYRLAPAALGGGPDAQRRS